MKLEHYLNKLEAIDQKIRLKASGSPEQFAASLGMSKASLHRYLDFLKDYGAPIIYDVRIKSYAYEYDVNIQFQFKIEPLSSVEERKIIGGESLFYKSENIFRNFLSVSKNEIGGNYLSIVR
jgi:biotin operon repressor